MSQKNKETSRNLKQILQNYLSETIDIAYLASQIPETLLQDHLPLEIPINIHSLVKCRKWTYLFEELILQNYKRFLKLLNSSLYEMLSQYYAHMPNLPKPDFLLERTLYSYPNFTNFPFIEAPLNDFEFKSYISQSKTGQLIHLQSIQVLKIYPLECFLYIQLYIKSCDCSISKSTPYYLKHGFLDVLKTSYSDLKAVFQKRLMACETCKTPFKESQANRVFLNCQKVEAFIPELSKKTHLWLLDGFLNKLEPGMRFNGVCYYDINLDYTIQNSRYIANFREYFVLISANIYLNIQNRAFFQGLSPKKPIQPPSNNVFEQWMVLKEFCNRSVGEGIIPKETLMGFKFGLFLSVIMKNRAFLGFYSGKDEIKAIIKPNIEFQPICDEYNLHLFIIGESEGIILRTILDLGSKLDNFGVWPYNSDESTLYEFLLHQQNGIIFIPDAGVRLKKQELYLLTKILRREEIELPNKEKFHLNACLWFYGSPSQNISGKKGNNEIWTVRDVLGLESFDNLDLVIDISRRNNILKKIKHEKLDKKGSDLLLESFLTDINKPLGQKSFILQRNPFLEKINLDYHNDEEDNKGILVPKDPIKLMQAYFKVARKAKAYSISNYNSFRKICTSLSLVRSFYLEKPQKIQLIDVIIGIMLDEITTGNKFKENEKFNTVVFGMVKSSRIGSFWLDCEGQEEREDEIFEFKKEDMVKTSGEREKKAFYEIYEEIIELCCRNDNGYSN